MRGSGGRVPEPAQRPPVLPLVPPCWPFQSRSAPRQSRMPDVTIVSSIATGSPRGSTIASTRLEDAARAMESKVATRLKMLGPNLSLTGVIVTLAVGVILPVLLSTTVGIVSLAMGERTNNLVVGVLVICFAAAAIGGAVTATVLVGRKARTARLQSDFLASVSHELRTPLAAIRMYAQTLRMGRLENDAARTEQSLDTIVRETMWLETMIERVLTWRSAAKDRMVLEQRVAGISGAMDDAVERFRALVPEHDMELVVDLDGGAPILHDRNAVAMMFLNLLINAYKYSVKEERIAYIRSRDEGGEIVIEVEDRGIGIPLSERRKVFQPFHRVDTRLRARSSGAGLGLAIARAVVVAHGGRIEVGAAAGGRGSLFVIHLPVMEEGGDGA